MGFLTQQLLCVISCNSSELVDCGLLALRLLLIPDTTSSTFFLVVTKSSLKGVVLGGSTESSANVASVAMDTEIMLLVDIHR